MHHSIKHNVPRRHVVALGVDRHPRDFAVNDARERVKPAYILDFPVIQFDTDRIAL